MTLRDFMESNDWKEIDLAYHSGISLNTVKHMLEKKHRASGNTIILLDCLMCAEGLTETERLAVIRDVTQEKSNA